MKKRYAMLDGILVGTRLTSVTLDNKDMKAVRKLMANYGAIELGGSDIEVVIEKKSKMRLSLRRHKVNRDEYYLNLSGNPLTFFKGSNVYGYIEADQMIVKAFKYCVAELGPKFPSRIVDAIDGLDINLNSLEFAVYTNTMPDKKQILNDWAAMYRHAYSSPDGRAHDALLDLLDLKFDRKHKNHKSSVALKIMSRDGSEEIAMLQAYDKQMELQGKNADVVDDIKNRIRLDLNLNYGWFRRHSINSKKIKTLKDLVQYVEKQGGWQEFVRKEFEWALERTCLFHMWEFDTSRIEDQTYTKGDEGYLKLEPRVYEALVDARLNLRVTDEARRLRRQGKHDLAKSQQQANPHPYLMKIELGSL